VNTRPYGKYKCLKELRRREHQRRENETVWKEDGEMIGKVSEELRVRDKSVRTHKEKRGVKEKGSPIWNNSR
jgi:hypothetical protein